LLTGRGAQFLGKKGKGKDHFSLTYIQDWGISLNNNPGEGTSLSKVLEGSAWEGESHEMGGEGKRGGFIFPKPCA